MGRVKEYTPTFEGRDLNRGNVSSKPSLLRKRAIPFATWPKGLNHDSLSFKRTLEKKKKSNYGWLQTALQKRSNFIAKCQNHSFKPQDLSAIFLKCNNPTNWRKAGIISWCVVLQLPQGLLSWCLSFGSNWSGVCMTQRSWLRGVIIKPFWPVIDYSSTHISKLA